jgi:hypothetical protein
MTAVCSVLVDLVLLNLPKDITISCPARTIVGDYEIDAFKRIDYCLEQLWQNLKPSALASPSLRLATRTSPVCFTLIAAASRRQNPLVSQANRVEPAGALELIRRL